VQGRPEKLCGGVYRLGGVEDGRTEERSLWRQENQGTREINHQYILGLVKQEMGLICKKEMTFFCSEASTTADVC
jgi:hypothetical protein